MSGYQKLLLFGLLLGLALGAGWLWLRGRPAVGTTPQGALPDRPADITGFARADGPRPLRFPADHGPHPEFQTEWWYYTGSLQGEDGRRFGFQLTFFRRALQPPGQVAQRSSDWGVSQVYMAHFALTDVQGERFQAFERLQRGAAGLAGAQAEPFQVWLDDWRVAQADQPDPACPAGEACAYELRAVQGEAALALRLLDRKGPVLQGERGFSRKGAAPGQASYYYSQTRLQADGELSLSGQTYRVSGFAWMDHEFSTSALEREQVGWDWFSIQLDDGSELMLFQIRRADGSIDPFSSGSLIAADGTVTPLQRDEFTLQPSGRWTSPRSGAVYPSGWRLSVPGVGLELQAEPLLVDQELNVSYAYWEGAVRFSGTRSGAPVSGYGYVELTGYSGSMGGEF